MELAEICNSFFVEISQIPAKLAKISQNTFFFMSGVYFRLNFNKVSGKKNFLDKKKKGEKKKDDKFS